MAVSRYFPKFWLALQKTLEKFLRCPMTQVAPPQDLFE
jgi:hypothetical protein